MKLKIITPVGPGHGDIAARCRESVSAAKQYALSKKCLWSNIDHILVDDSQGKMGRSKARNSEIHGADWYFFLDADDIMTTDALMHNDFDYTATFGCVSPLNWDSEYTLDKNIFVTTIEEVKEKILMTLSMGFFYRDCGLRFNEDLDIAEDFEFYTRLPDFIKLKKILVKIDNGYPSASGPRGYSNLKWVEACRDMLKKT